MTRLLLGLMLAASLAGCPPTTPPPQQPASTRPPVVSCLFEGDDQSYEYYDRNGNGWCDCSPPPGDGKDLPQRERELDAGPAQMPNTHGLCDPVETSSETEGFQGSDGTGEIEGRD